MKVIRNKLLPLKGFAAINLFGILFVRKDSKITDRLLNHEAIHTAQMKELGYIFFYIWYVIEWFIKLFTTKNAYKSISFENINSNEERKKMIHKHQIKSLLKFSDYKNVVAGFVFNFRDKNNDAERTYFQEVSSFYSMSKRIQKQSFNEVDLLLNDCVKIAGEKKRVNYRWDIKNFLDDYKENYNG